MSRNPLGSRRRQPPPPGPEWQQRANKAREIIRLHRHSEETEFRLDRVEQTLHDAWNDRSKLQQTISVLEPDRVAAELKSALRASDTPSRLLSSLQERHETVNDLMNRADRLEQQINATVADLETLAARTVHLVSIGVTGDSAMAGELEQLQIDVSTLTAAHTEIADL